MKIKFGTAKTKLQEDTAKVKQKKQLANSGTETGRHYPAKSNISDMPTVTLIEIPSWALHIECPHCKFVQTDWLCDPKGMVVNCSSCGKDYKIDRILSMVIT